MRITRSSAAAALLASVFVLAACEGPEGDGTGGGGMQEGGGMQDGDGMQGGGGMQEGDGMQGGDGMQEGGGQ